MNSGMGMEARREADGGTSTSTRREACDDTSMENEGRKRRGRAQEGAFGVGADLHV